jgi:hypothetical protein
MTSKKSCISTAVSIFSKACTTFKNDSKIKISDPRSMSAVFENSERVQYCLIRFDGCVLKNQTACDWIIEKMDVGRIAVELKGSDIDHAAKQLTSSPP